MTVEKTQDKTVGRFDQSEAATHTAVVVRTTIPLEGVIFTFHFLVSSSLDKPDYLHL